MRHHPAGLTVLLDGEPVALDGAVAETIRQLVRLAPALAPLDRWQARVDVAGRSVRVCADAPVHPPPRHDGVR